MANFTVEPHVTITATFTVNEAELRALDALAGYGDDAFISIFYEKLGKAYMEKHEHGLRRFLVSVREHAPRHLAALDRALKAVTPKGY